jgi:predicted amidohydrolase YtcJ
MRQMPLRSLLKLLLAVLAIIAMQPIANAQIAPCFNADLIARNGHIVTMAESNAIVSAIAISDGRIQAVGTDAEISACASPLTRIVDLHGHTVLPGLIDVHTHTMEWAEGILRDQLDATYPKVHSIADIVAMVRERAAKTPKGQWISGAGWDDAKFTEHRYITRKDLDAAAPDNPVYLEHVSGHLIAVNSAALKLAGITRDSADPTGGVIEKDSAGEPTGILKDTAMDLAVKLLPPDPPDIYMRAARLISERALALGLTTIHDIYITPDEIRGYQDAYTRGWLKLRVQMSPRIGSIEDAEQLAKMGIHTGYGNDTLKFGAAKMFADGGMGARTIAIYPPPVEGEPNNFGVLRWKPEDMHRAHLIAARAGWQLETHAIGDRAIDEVLDSYAAVMKELNLTDARFRIVHAGISTPAIQKRLADLHVLVDGNPPFVYWIGSWFKKYGPERVRWSYPAKSYIANGVIEAAGSDVPVTPLSPWWGIWAAVARKDLATGDVLAPEERITIEEALRLYTYNGAYAGFEEKTKGTLEPGKLADFIVLDRDVLTVPTDQLKDVQVLETYVGGALVSHAAPSGPTPASAN